MACQNISLNFSKLISSGHFLSYCQIKSLSYMELVYMAADSMIDFLIWPQFFVSNQLKVFDRLDFSLPLELTLDGDRQEQGLVLLFIIRNECILGWKIIYLGFQIVGDYQLYSKAILQLIQLILIIQNNIIGMAEQSQQFYFQRQIQPQLEFLRSICPQTQNIEKIQDLSDGLTLHEILKPFKFSHNQDKPSFHPDPLCFLHRLQNLKYLLRLIQKYWSQCLKQQLSEEKQVDIILISKDKNVQQIKKFVKIIVKTLFHSQQRQTFIEKMLQMSENTQEYFMKIVQQSLGQKKGQNFIGSQNSNEHSLYEKIIQLEQQNERILKILNQVYEQKQEAKQKQKQTEQKLEQKQKELKKLTWQVTLFNCQKRQNLDKISLNYFQEKKVNQSLKMEIKQWEIKQKNYLHEIQRQGGIIQILNSKLKQFNILQQELKSQNKENLSLKIQNQNLQIKLTHCQQKFIILDSEKKQLKSENDSKKMAITELQSRIEGLNSLILNRQQQIKHLEENIHFLTSQEQNSQKAHSNQRPEPKSSIKSECQQIINQYQQKNTNFYLSKYKRQIISLKSQAQKMKQQKRQFKEVIESQNQEISKLKQYEEENKKLVQMISHMNKYRGQQNQILVKTIYKLRMKLLGQELKKQNLMEKGKKAVQIKGSAQNMSQRRQRKQIKNTPQCKRSKQPLKQIINQNSFISTSK